MSTFRGQGTSPVDQNIWSNVVVERSKHWISDAYETLFGKLFRLYQLVNKI